MKQFAICVPKHRGHLTLDGKKVIQFLCVFCFFVFFVFLFFVSCVLSETGTQTGGGLVVPGFFEMLADGPASRKPLRLHDLVARRDARPAAA